MSVPFFLWAPALKTPCRTRPSSLTSQSSFHLLKRCQTSSSPAPRRFGKSLVLQMRMCSYDKKNAGDNEFDKVCSSLILLFFVLSLQTSIQLSLFSLSMQLFGSLWIREKGPDGKHPHKTEDQGKYVILDIDFGPKKEPTQFNTDEEYAARFDVIILESIRECVDKYGLTLPASVLGVTTDPASALKNLCMAAGSTPSSPSSTSTTPPSTTSSCGLPFP